MRLKDGLNQQAAFYGDRNTSLLKKKKKKNVKKDLFACFDWLLLASLAFDTSTESPLRTPRNRFLSKSLHWQNITTKLTTSHLKLWTCNTEVFASFIPLMRWHMKVQGVCWNVCRHVCIQCIITLTLLGLYLSVVV